MVKLEAEGFYGTLAGSDFASTGVANKSGAGGQADDGTSAGEWGGGLAADDPRRVALRDTLCAGFRRGLATRLPPAAVGPRGEEAVGKGAAGVAAGGDPHEGALCALRPACDALIRLALALTAGVVA